jgi:hypothetical protein
MGWAKLMRSVGGHCLEDLVQYFRLPDIPEVGVERDEFEEARRRLSRAPDSGYRMRMCRWRTSAACGWNTPVE